MRIMPDDEARKNLFLDTWERTRWLCHAKTATGATRREIKHWLRDEDFRKRYNGVKQDAENGALTERQMLFVENYIIDFNPRAAADRAGYSPGTSIHRDLMANERVQSAIKEAIEERNRRLKLQQDEVVQGLVKIARANITDVMEWGTREEVLEGKTVESQYAAPVNSDELDPDVSYAIAEVAQTKDGIRIKMHSKPDALTQLGRHEGLFTDKTEHSGKIEGLSDKSLDERISAILDAGRERRAGEAPGGEGA